MATTNNNFNAVKFTIELIGIILVITFIITKTELLQKY